MKSIPTKALLWAAGLAGSLLAFGAQQVWADVRDHSVRIPVIETDARHSAELLREIRQDVKDILRNTSRP